MKKIIFYLIVILGLTSFKTTGVRTAYLNCKSESGRTLFTAEIVDIDVRLTKAELTIDGEKLSFTEKDNSYIVFDSKNGVFTMYLQTKSQLKKDFPNSKFLKFWAIPKTFKTLIEESTDGKYEFKAKMYSTEPRKSKGSPTPEIEMICELEYEI